MKKLMVCVGVAALALMVMTCGNSSGSREKTGIYEPQTEEEFISILEKEMGVKPYPGAEIARFTHLTDATLAYKVPSEGNTNKAILDYYKQAFAQAFKDREEWRKFADTDLSVTYMKGFDLTLTFTLTSKNAARELAGDMAEVPKYLKFEITLGDGADSF